MNIEQKRVEFDSAAFGSIGLESAFGLLNQLFGIEKSIALLTKGRERYNIGITQLKQGEKACLTLFDPDEEYTFGSDHILSTSKNSLALGKLLKGKVYGVFNKNQLILR